MTQPEQVQISFRISAELATALERIAADEDRTVSAELRRLIRRHVSPTQPETPPKTDPISGSGDVAK